MATHVARVVVERGEKSVSVGIPGDSRRYNYLESEAESSAVCIALGGVIRQISRWEVPAGDGFTVRVEFVNEAGEPLAAPAAGFPASGRGDLHANMAWLERNRGVWGGYWVALRDGVLMATGESRSKLQEHLVNHPHLREMTVLYMEPLVEPGDAASAEMEAVADADEG